MMVSIAPIRHLQPKQNKSKDSGKQTKKIPTTLEGVLLNKSRESNNFEPNSNLIILSEKDNETGKRDLLNENSKTTSFNVKKALTPLIIGTLSLLAGTAAISTILKSGAKTLKNTKPFEQLPDLALNMNIRQEPQFATYMMLRNPNTKTIFGALGVFVMSGITLIAKNFADGIKEIWVKKQESDIQRDLQENLIETETRVFSGKLNTERTLLSETAQYFNNIFNVEKESVIRPSIPSAFKSIHAFKGSFKKKENQDNSEKNTAKKNIRFASLIGLTTLAGILFGKITFKNLKKAASEANEFTNKVSENVIDAITDISKKGKDASVEGIERVTQLFETINAKPQFIKETLTNMGADEVQISKTLQRVADSTKSIFADAPVALGGITKKIQYYCYIDEDRGHLYNWIINPESKFMKYLFLAFTSVSAIGYVGKQLIDALKSVAVSKENSNTELALQNKLVDVEVNNFKSKKDSAIKPLLDEFNLRLSKGESEENLKTLADNILVEIKNGPPFVYA